jgi:alpha-acetolactate decarboxylase
MPLETRTPFVVVSTLDNPTTVRLRDASREEVAAAVEDLVDDAGAVVSVRLEGAFTSVLVRSVPAQDPPYRPYAEVCVTDEVRWTHAPFYGVFVGFRFPDLEPGATIPGLHLHGLNRLRTTGGHNHDLHVKDAVLSVGVSRDVVLHLPDKSMLDLLETPAPMRAVQRRLLRSGPRTIAELSADLGADPAEVTSRIDWLADRGFITPDDGEPTGAGGEPRWRVALHTQGARASRDGGRSAEVDDLLESLEAEEPA